MEKEFDKRVREKFDKMEQSIRKQDLFKILLESLEKSTEEIYELRQKEINLLQRLLDVEETITHLISELAKEKFSKEQKS